MLFGSMCLEMIFIRHISSVLVRTSAILTNLDMAPVSVSNKLSKDVREFDIIHKTLRFQCQVGFGYQ